MADEKDGNSPATGMSSDYPELPRIHESILNAPATFPLFVITRLLASSLIALLRDSSGNFGHPNRATPGGDIKFSRTLA